MSTSIFPASNEVAKSDVPVRIQLSRRGGWRMPANTVKVCRPGPFGNPYKAGDPHIGSNADAKMAFFNFMWRTEKGIALSERARRELRGKNLACWCKPGEPCHADVLLKIANESRA